MQTTEDIRNSADATVTVKTIGFDGHAFGGDCDILIGDVLIGTDALAELVKALRR